MCSKRTIVIATHNPEKVREFQKMAEGHPVVFQSLAEAGIDVELVETGATFDENALCKARPVHALTDEIVMADDSGLAVDALNGAPGIYSSRYAGASATDRDRIEKLLRALESATDRRASFRCSIAVIFPSGEERIYHGVLPGTIAKSPRGQFGFGYDPIFIPEGETRTMAEFSEEEKNAVSHRGRALRAFFDDFGLTSERGGRHGEA